MAQSRPGSSLHLGPLDGLRAIAIGLVLLYHLTPGHQSNLGVRALLFKVADLGWCGVDLFFVLSGFLITGKLLEGRSEPTPFRSFYARRALRIFPLYYLVLLLVLLLVPALRRDLSAGTVGEQLPFWLYYSNFTSALPPVNDLIHIGHFWSLAVEEQFYLVWPAVILLVSPLGSIRICTLLLALAPAARLAAVLHGAGWAVTYGWTPLRADGLLAGAILALLRERGAPRRTLVRWSLAVVAAAGPALFWIAWTDRAGLIFHPLESSLVGAVRVLLPSLLAVFFAALLLLALELPLLARPLSGSLLRPVALYSYGIYVFHYMLVPFLNRWLPPERLSARLGSPNLGAFAFFLVGSTAVFVLAALSYHGYERHFLTLKPPRRDAGLQAATKSGRR